MASSFVRFLDHKQRRITVSRTPLDAWTVRRRDLYLTTHDTHNRQISMPPMGFEPTISAVERPQAYALARAATGTGANPQLYSLIPPWCWWSGTLFSGPHSSTQTHFSILSKDIVQFSKLTVPIYQTTWRRTTEKNSLHSHRHYNDFAFNLILCVWLLANGIAQSTTKNIMLALI